MAPTNGDGPSAHAALVRLHDDLLSTADDATTNMQNRVNVVADHLKAKVMWAHQTCSRHVQNHVNLIDAQQLAADGETGAPTPLLPPKMAAAKVTSLPARSRAPPVFREPQPNVTPDGTLVAYACPANHPVERSARRLPAACDLPADRSAHCDHCVP